MITDDGLSLNRKKQHNSCANITSKYIICFLLHPFHISEFQQYNLHQQEYYFSGSNSHKQHQKAWF